MVRKLIVIGIDGCIIAQTAGIVYFRLAAFIQQRIPDHGSGECLKLDPAIIMECRFAKCKTAILVEIFIFNAAAFQALGAGVHQPEMLADTLFPLR